MADHFTCRTRAHPPPRPEPGGSRPRTDHARLILTPGDAVVSPETRFSTASSGCSARAASARSTSRGGSDARRVVPEIVCIKVSAHIDGWLREAYFGQLLDGHPRAIRVFDAFPLHARRTAGSSTAWRSSTRATATSARSCSRAGKGWPEATARREIAGILEVLGKLHRGQMLHRDLTPMNVFVCDDRRLKLGDFGIVRQQSDRRGITARTMNALTAPSDILAGAVPKWQARDDVYQVGQLLAMLVKGDARARIRTGEVRALACSDHLKEIVYRCIGERRKRYESADELIDALRNAAGVAEGRRAADR